MITGSVVGGAAGLFSTFTYCVIFAFAQSNLTVLGWLDPLILVLSLAGGILAAALGGLLGKGVALIAATGKDHDVVGST